MSVVFALVGHRRRVLRLDQGDDQNIAHIEADQHHARQEGAEEHVAGAGRSQVEFDGHGEAARRLGVFRLAQGARPASRVGQLIGQDDEYDGRRDDLPQGARRGDGAGRQGRGIFVAHHHREGDQPHGDHRRPDDARGRREQRADEHHRDAEAAGDRPEKLGHGDQQILGNLGSLQHDAHEDEQRDGDQRVAFDLPVDAAEIGHARVEPLGGSALDKISVRTAGEQRAEDRGQGDGGDGRSGQGEGHRIARQQGGDQEDEQKGEKNQFHQPPLASGEIAPRSVAPAGSAVASGSVSPSRTAALARKLLQNCTIMDRA